MGTYSISRERMVRDVCEKLAKDGVTIRNRAVLDAMKKVPRHLFVEEVLQARAYTNVALPIGYGQTISEPSTVALMSDLLEAEPGMRVLEIGTGSGYQAAILDAMKLDVHSVERIRELHFRTSDFLWKNGFRGIRLKLADGTLGWPEAAPFDRILVAAGGPEVPAPLVEQLADPGILLLPVGEGKRSQHMVLVRKEKGRVTQKTLSPTTFVDLVGRHGWNA